MSKQVSMLFQDCYDCGNDQTWYKEQSKKAATLGIQIVPVPHTFPGAKGLIIRASAHGCQKLPCFTDGKRYGYDITKFAENKFEERKTKKVKAKDGDSKETE